MGNGNGLKAISQWVAYQVIRRVHDGPAMEKKLDPLEALRRLGLKEGAVVLEPGCGPGFYTLAAAEIVESRGTVHAFDVNPYMIKCLKEKLDRLQLRNVQACLRNANETGLDDSCVDFCFLIGVPRIDGGMEELLRETARVCRPGALLIFQAERREPEDLVGIMQRSGFCFKDRIDTYVRFTRERT